MSARLHREEGIALPIAILVLGLALALTGTLLLSATRSSAGSDADRQVKRALQAADAGLDVARDEINRLKPSATQCIAVNATATGTAPAGSAYLATAPSSPAPCPSVGGTLADGTAYGFQLTTTSPRTIVSTGSAGAGATATTRRVAATLTGSASTQSLFGDVALSSDSSISLTDSSDIEGSLRTNGNLGLSGSARIGGDAQALGSVSLTNTAQICGDVVYGSATTAPPAAKVCGARSPTATRFTYPANPGAAISTAITDTSNLRICVLDPCSSVVTERGYNAVTRTLSLTGAGTVTLAGTQPYVFCAISATNASKIIIPSGASVRIVIDAPENCGSASGGISMTNSATFDNRNCTAAPYPSSTLQLYVLGSASRATSVRFSNSSGACLTAFAPNSDVSFTGGGTLNGAVAAKSVSLSNNAGITTNASTMAITGGGSSGTATTNYRECVTAATTIGGCDTS